ncbi:MAG: hypothetical protein JXQ97_00130 [Natronospirillum sp.]
MKRLQTLILVLFLGLLTACGDDDLANGGTDEGELDPRLQRPLGDQSILGRAIYQDALPWSPIFVQDIIENDLDLLFSTVTDADGGFRLLGVFNRAGMVSTFATPNADEPMYSLYSALPNDPATRVNITPVTDALTRIYLWNNFSDLTADTCYYDLACAQMLNANYQHTDEFMNLYLTNLRTWLENWWTADTAATTTTIQPFTTPLSISDPMDRMLTALRFRVFEEEVPVDATDPDSPLVNAKFLSVCNRPANQELTINVRDLGNPSYERPADLLPTSPCAPDPIAPAAFNIAIDANPANGPAPLTTSISITFPAGEPEGLMLQSMLVNPLGQPIAFWTTPTFSTTLTGAGQYRVQTLASAIDGAVQAGTTVTVDGPVVDPRFATWGQTGSWRRNLEFNSSPINNCAELLDGSPINQPYAMSYQDVFYYPVGLCSRTAQFDYPLIGWCSYFLQETRLYYYRHPQSELNESLAVQRARNRSVCQNGGGIWSNSAL